MKKTSINGTPTANYPFFSNDFIIIFRLTILSYVLTQWTCHWTLNPKMTYDFTTPVERYFKIMQETNSYLVSSPAKGTKHLLAGKEVRDCVNSLNTTRLSRLKLLSLYNWSLNVCHISIFWNFLSPLCWHIRNPDEPFFDFLFGIWKIRNRRTALKQINFSIEYINIKKWKGLIF